MNSSDVPQSITFGKKILFIPSLEEMGISLAGLGFNIMNSELINQYNLNHGHSTWIKKGDKLLTYTFHAFTKEKSTLLERLMSIIGLDYSALSQTTTSQTWSIVSPVNGLMISARNEQTSETNRSSGLIYRNQKESILPVILIASDEPLPDNGNFYTYDKMASWLSSYFNLLFLRHPDDFFPSRLKDVVARWSSKFPYDDEWYSKEFDTLKNRNSKAYKNYEIREINSNDSALISHMQDMRDKFLDLREKLVHISREFGETI